MEDLTAAFHNDHICTRLLCSAGSEAKSYLIGLMKTTSPGVDATCSYHLNRLYTASLQLKIRPQPSRRQISRVCQHYTKLCCTILYYTILYYTILYYTILYYTILYYTILYYTILYYTILLLRHDTEQLSGRVLGTAESSIHCQAVKHKAEKPYGPSARNFRIL